MFNISLHFAGVFFAYCVTDSNKAFISLYFFYFVNKCTKLATTDKLSLLYLPIG